MIKIVTSSPEETENFAHLLSEKLSGGEVIAFRGGMGMGKTCFTRGLARGLGFEGQVTSPTFALVNEYIGGRLPLYHFDMYRVESWEDLYSSGYFDYLEAGGVIAAEWSENIENALDGKVITIEFSRLSDNAREITVTGVDL
ncbi:MAG: tRNA (adenosine(37)-N6)-threonylcarbamoyltransferase complex ATPase subunit type 1 TsaE [Clostridia bacterium]|nr:tRNA (adenosine(37)-N6)-threonylcarbamoyltransferase complex ATPase subunit type 1 TsaE [Clostridia bacterium]